MLNTNSEEIFFPDSAVPISHWLKNNNKLLQRTPQLGKLWWGVGELVQNSLSLAKSVQLVLLLFWSISFMFSVKRRSSVLCWHGYREKHLPYYCLTAFMMGKMMLDALRNHQEEMETDHIYFINLITRSSRKWWVSVYIYKFWYMLINLLKSI